MKSPAVADIQRWSADVAQDASSLSFLPLARAYRKQGQREAALRLCLRGLEAHPNNVEAHGLLALLYLESGDRTRAADEWSMVLRLDPANFEALRGLGFCALEDDELSRARQFLERAALIRPSDGAVREALRLLRERQQQRAAAPPEPPTPQQAAPLTTTDRTAPVSAPADPGALFNPLLSGPLLGVLLIDQRGLVLAGRLSEGSGELVGAILSGAIGETTRTVEHLALGDWHGVLLETERATLQLSPVGEDAAVLLAARREAPTGWVLRVSEQATALARSYLGAAT
jgi:tetratricopeptide (TPR) repeat protein